MRRKDGEAGGAPLHLDMRIRDFGPIKRASISLRPLTIFVGPSNTGKSYAAMLAHSIISSCGGAGMRPYPLVDSRDNTGALERLLKSIGGGLAGLKPGKAVDCPPALAARIGRFCSRSYAKKVQNEIERNFGLPMGKLARFQSGRFFMSLENSSSRIMTHGSRGMALDCVGRPRIRFELTDSARRGHDHVARLGDGAIGCTLHRDLILDKNLQGLRSAYEKLEREVVLGPMSCLPSASQYFPAGRTGILEAHRVISTGIIRSAPYGGIEDVQVPRLSGTVSDFVSDIIEMRPRPGQYRELGEQVERDVLGGHVDLRPTVGGAAPELVYRHRLGVNLPVRLASSAVSELAPLALYLKHGGRRGGMLVIEEPEAHLHPRSQRLLARHLVRLVRGGVSVIITTHSAILLEVASQCLQACKMTPRDRKRALGDEGLYLGAGDVAPHLFRLDRNDAAFAEEIPMSTDEGISQEEFIEVDRTLNIDNIRIEEHLN